MKPVRQLLIAFLLVIIAISCLVHGRRGGGRASFGGGRRSRGGSRFRGGSSRTRRPTNRNLGYGRMSSGRTIPASTSLYSRRYGSYSMNRRTSSYNGFGMGLGVGMFLGYRRGWLGYPIGYGRHNYNYDYIHKDRNYNQDKPLKCALNDISEFLRPQSELQELNVDEGELTCKSAEEVCYGKILVVGANFTNSNGQRTEGLEVRVEKGCALSSYLGSVSDETYNSSRKCWTSKLDGISVEEDNNDYMNNSLEIFKALKLNWENYTTEITIQSQTCFCSGWYCNGGKSCQLVTKSVLLMSLISVIHTHTYIYMNSNCDY